MSRVPGHAGSCSPGRRERDRNFSELVMPLDAVAPVVPQTDTFTPMFPELLDDIIPPSAARYKEEEPHTASRSGHCAALLWAHPGRRDGRSLYVFGGRESEAADWIGHWKTGKVKDDPSPSPRLSEQLSHLVSSGKAKREAPRSLRHHSCSVVGPFLVVFGGESLSRSRDAVCGDLYICDTRCTPMSWFRFPGSDPLHRRVAHRTCLLNDRLYLVGGFGADGRTPCREIFVLDVYEEQK
ncbi:kelch domain-containing protein 9 isoform X2 [Hyla sarda]|uniref:kelch domain-containing protein 9 isoform X2 n=1 Tax=Hyla sarda TaxID=327740 RepID=UPI0024C24085|nr:kelch domain-containing protein 9 isoform X2 [Hyla sarda]